MAVIPGLWPLRTMYITAVGRASSGVWSDRRRLKICKIGSLVLALCLMPVFAFAQPMRAAPVRARDLCKMAIGGNAPISGRPVNLLDAIGRVESGRLDPSDGTVKAWPWSVNAEGRGSVFNTKAEAIAGVLALRARNVMSVDVGCMQVNLMYHPSAFASLEEAFDPTLNVGYAAKFLSQLYAETRDWKAAAAFYHSRTPDLALTYQRKVLAQLPDAAHVRLAPRVQLASTEQLSLTKAWAATLGAPQPPATGQALGALFAQAHTRILQQARSHPIMLARTEGL